ncbi:hypothetical protein Tco_1068212 [Tanacetum coccineum]|uniref:Uncharacterized protein n=1 Tax=Tanacetum coccineum TaxID=301880 RepID=A0ABQ5HF21_9ASTR
MNDDMYNWVIAKYGKPNNWTDSQFESIADDVYTTFFEKAEPEKPEPAKTTNVETQQDFRIPDRNDTQSVLNLYAVSRVNLAAKVSPTLIWYDDEKLAYLENNRKTFARVMLRVIVIGSSSSELECSSTLELECSSTSKLEFPSSDELNSYVSSYDELDSSDESGSLEKSVSEKEIDEEDDVIDEEAEDGKDDSDDELWSPKSIGTTSRSLLSPKMKGTSSKSTPTTKKLVEERSEPIRNCISGSLNNKTWEMIVNKEFGVKKEQANENKEQVKKGKRKLGV